MLDEAMLDLTQPLVFTVEGLLSPEECAALILRIEAEGFSPAPVSTAQGALMQPDVRNNTRVLLKDKALAEELFLRARPHIPKTFKSMEAVGANELFRCYRYTPGQRFITHTDGYFQRNERERSFLTFMVYLNEGMGGGETAFLAPEQVIAPKTGLALFFQHYLWHEGREVKSGVKY